MTRSYVPQLQAVLNLEGKPQQFHDAKVQWYNLKKADSLIQHGNINQEKIKILVRRYLDIHQTGGMQTTAISKIMEKLKKKYPELYDGEDSNGKLFFLEKFILYVQVNRRKRARRYTAQRPLNVTTGNQGSYGQLASGVPSAESSVENLAATPNKSGESSNQFRAKKSSSSDLPSNSGQASGSSVSNNCDTKSVNESRLKDSPNFPLTALSVVRHHPKKGRFIPFVMVPSAKPADAWKTATLSTSQTPRHDRSLTTKDIDIQPPLETRPLIPSGSHAGPEPTSSLSSEATEPSGPTDHSGRTYDGSGIAFVREFLLACKPPMDRFLPLFVTFGWKNKAFLYAMSTWSDAYRYQMLSRVVGTRDGESHGGATEAEIAVLDYHLMRYGFQTEKENAEA